MKTNTNADTVRAMCFCLRQIDYIHHSSIHSGNSHQKISLPRFRAKNSPELIHKAIPGLPAVSNTEVKPNSYNYET